MILKSPYLEHINITVSNLDVTLEFLKLAFPEFKTRHRDHDGQKEWLHFGNDQFYVALFEYKTQKHSKNYSKSGINHAGFVVHDIERLIEQMDAAGYKRSYPLQRQPTRTRAYYFDADGNEYEFVEYKSDVFSERNDYSS